MPKIRVTGLAELNRGLRLFETDGPKSVQPVLKAFAERVAARARSRYRQRYRSSRRVDAGGIRGLATQTRAQVVLGRNSIPFLLGQEFGSLRHRQFPGWNGKAGYFFYPTIREETAEFTEDLGEALGAVAQRAFPTGTVARGRRLGR